MKATMKLTEKRRIESSINAVGRKYVVVCDDDHNESYPLFHVGVKLINDEFEAFHTYSKRSHAISSASDLAIDFLSGSYSH